MITPCFGITQTENFIEITVDTPYAHVSKEYEAEIHVDENEVLFYSMPYYLRLTFDKTLKEEGKTFCFRNGTFTIKVFKKIQGDHFEELENPAEHSDQQENVAASVTAPKYGFGNMKFGVLRELVDELVNVIDLREPDEVSEAERTEIRLREEDKSFDESHYLADLHENEDIEDLLSFSSFSEDEGSCELSEDQKNELSRIPIERFIQPSNSEQKKIAYFGLIDILLAYAYDCRATQGLHNIESGWTICKLSATLSWLDSFSDVPSVVRSFVRRSLCFPLCRNWELSLRVTKDVCKILRKGRKFILKCLLIIKGLLMDGYDHHILNQLYIDDYCIWIQHVKDEIFTKLANEVRKVKVAKEDLGFDLLILEEAGEAAIKSSRQLVDEADDNDSPDEDENEINSRMESIGQHIETLNIEDS